MDMPPSGWYPDPYGAVGLLRWWDGAAWTEHTYAEVTPAAAAPGADPTTFQPAVTSVQPAVYAPAVYDPAVTRVQPGAIQPGASQPAAIQPTTIQPTTIEPTAIQPTRFQSATADPTAVRPTTVEPGMQLAALHPPAGPRTMPQPAIPAGMGGAGAGDGTRVLILDDNAWGRSGAPAPRESGYYSARRRRRILLMSGLIGGVVVALVAVAFIVKSLGQSGGTTTASTTAPAAAAVEPSSAAPAPSATPSATPSAAPTAVATVTDATSGLTYGQLPSPFGPGCPTSLSNSAFTWTAGESATAGQVNNGQTTWYGEACSGQLPAQYGYNGTGDLQNVTTALVNTFNGTYYAALPHTMSTTVNEPTQISGHPAWEIQFLITYTSPQGLPFTNELGSVVVADPQTGAAPSVFYVSVPSNLNESNVGSLLSSLQLAAVAPTPSTTAAAPDGDGSPTAAAP
jgi:hypothetical protein